MGGMQIESLLSSRWDALLSTLPASLDLTALARSKQAIIRSRRVSDGETLLRLALWYGPCGLSLRGAAAQAVGTATADLSDVALFKRLAGAADWLEAIVTAVLAERQTTDVVCPRRLRLVDATTIHHPGSDGTDWILHSLYDPLVGFSGFELTDRHGGETLVRHAVGPDEIVIADRGYAHAKGLLHVLGQGADFIVRTGWRSLAFRDTEDQRLDLFSRLDGLPPGQVIDLPVNVAVAGQTFPVRLVVLAKDEAAVRAELRRVGRKAQKNQHVGDPRSRLGARYTMLVTSLDAGTYPAADVLSLYRLRWQIELAFKRLKSLLHLDRLPAKNKGLARTWLNAHLLLALLIDDMTQQLLDSPPCASSHGTPSGIEVEAPEDVDRHPYGLPL
jgi:hypothetical protein